MQVIAPGLVLTILASPALAQVPDSIRDSAYALPPVTITVTRGATPLSVVPMAVSAARSEDRPGRADLTLDDALAGLPGVYVADRSNYSLDQRLSIRGFGSRANFGLRGVKVLVDGVPQTLADGQSQLSNVEFGALDRVEVLRGPASSLYGNASGGVIALYTREPSALPFTQSLRVEAGSFGLFKVLSQTSARMGSAAGTLTASWFGLDGFRRHSRAEALRLAGTGTWAITPNLVGEIHLAHVDAPRADNPGALTRAEVDADPSQAAPNNLSRHAGKDMTQTQAAVTLRHLGPGANRWTVTLFGLHRDLANPLATNVYIAIGRVAGGARLEATHGLGWGTLTWGADLQRFRDDRTNRIGSLGSPTDTLLLDQRETVTELGPFAHLLWPLGSGALLSAGLRYDRVTFDVQDHFLGDSVDNSGRRTMAAWSGHLGVSLTGSETVIPYVSVATSFETPTSTELVNQPGGTGGFNDRLDPQHAVSLEAGVRGRPAPGIEYSAAAFLGRITDALIQQEEIGGRAFFVNAGKLHNDGIEAALTLSPGRRLGLQAAYTWAHYRFAEYRITSGGTTETLDGHRLAGVPDHALTLLARVAPASGLTVEWEQRFSSSLYADDANQVRVDGWGAGVAALRVTWRVPAGALEIMPFGGVNNLFDRRYIPSVTVNGFGGRFFEPGPDRNFYLGAEIRYRKGASE